MQAISPSILQELTTVEMVFHHFFYGLYHKFDFVLHHSTWCNIQFTLIKVVFFLGVA